MRLPSLVFELVEITSVEVIEVPSIEVIKVPSIVFVKVTSVIFELVKVASVVLVEIASVVFIEVTSIELVQVSGIVFKAIIFTGLDGGRRLAQDDASLERLDGFFDGTAKIRKQRLADVVRGMSYPIGAAYTERALRRKA